MWWKRALGILAIAGLLGMVGWQEHKFIENADRVHRAQIEETTHARLLLEENARVVAKMAQIQAGYEKLEYDLATTVARHDRDFEGRIAQLGVERDRLAEANDEALKQIKTFAEERARFMAGAATILNTQAELSRNLTAVAERLAGLKRWASVPKFMHDATVRIRLAPSADNPVPPGEADFCIGAGFKIGRHVVGTAKHVAQDAWGNQRRGLEIQIGDKWVPVSASFVDPDHDLALLIVQPDLDGVVQVPAKAPTEVFDPVIVVGNPAGSSITASVGYLSTKNSLWSTLVHEPWWQSSANAYGGNSGGPVFDANSGDLIGVLVAGVPGAPNVSMFVPVEFVRALLDRYEHR